MALVLPSGWKNFSGGGSDPSLCGEPQDCDNPPCGEIPPMELVPVDDDGNPTGVPQELSCVFGEDGHSLNLRVYGGVGPFTWEATSGAFTVSGFRTGVIDIGPPEGGTLAEKVGRIAFFKPHMFTFAYELTIPQSSCIIGHTPLDYSLGAAADVRLRAYDCLKRYIPNISDDGPSSLDNLAPDFDDPIDLRDHPIGDNPADRSCEIAVDWGFHADGAVPESEPDHWSVSSDGCNTNDPGNVSVHVTAELAGKNGIHGTIHAAAPAFDETKNVPMDVVSNPSEAVEHDVDFENYMDVRTQTQIDSGCCVVPAGESVIVIVTDARGVSVPIEIPVV